METRSQRLSNAAALAKRLYYILAAVHRELPFDLIYPNTENVIYLPLDLDGKLSRAIFRAVHRDMDAILYWHLDGVFLGETEMFHEKMIREKPGKHTLVLVDKNGQRLERTFTIVGGGD